MPKHKPRELIIKYAWNRPALSPLNVILKAAKNIISQSKCRILHALHELRKQRARKISVVQADSTVTFHTITSSTSLFGLSTLNSNRTNHKLRKKLANQKRRHIYVLATLRDSNTILCTNSQTLYTEGLERLRRRQNGKPRPLHLSTK